MTACSFKQDFPRRKLSMAHSCSRLVIAMLAMITLSGWSSVFQLGIEIKGVSGAGWPSDFRKILFLMKETDCREASKLLWAKSKKGNMDALYLLAEAASLGLRLPSGSNHTQSGSDWRLRNNLALFSYASAKISNTQMRGVEFYEGLRKTIPRMLAELGENQNAQKVIECYASGFENSICLKLAISLRVIPSFKEFSRDVDKREIRPGDWVCDNYPDRTFGLRSRIDGRSFDPVNR